MTFPKIVPRDDLSNIELIADSNQIFPACRVQMVVTQVYPLRTNYGLNRSVADGLVTVGNSRFYCKSAGYSG